MIQPQEYAERRAHAAARLREHKLDALVITALPNIRYLTGFTGSNALLLLTPDSARLFTDPRYTLQASSETGCDVTIAGGSLVVAASKVLARKRRKTIGFERARIAYGTYSELQDALPLGSELQPVGPAVEALRAVKSPAEIELIRRSVQTNSRAFAAAVSRIKPGTTESALAAQIEFRMRTYGAEGVAFDSIVAAGPRSALPHARPTAAALGTDRLLLVDIGALQGGYCSDMTRVLHLGAPGKKARKLYRAVLEAQLAAIDAVREGVTADQVDRAARRVLRSHGLEKEFVHSTGHGLGLEIHEAPRIGKRDKTRLQAGMVITIEPGAYVMGFGGVRIEDTVVVTSNGCDILTPTSKELLTV